MQGGSAWFTKPLSGWIKALLVPEPSKSKTSAHQTGRTRLLDLRDVYSLLPRRLAHRPGMLLLLNLLKKLVRVVLLAPVLLVLLFEEWGWMPLARAFATLGRLPWWAALERLITHLPPWAALITFTVPGLVLIPVKLLALAFFARGHFAMGLFLIIMAKVIGTAIAARLFQLTHPALMRMPWFARLYGPWKVWKDKLLNRVRASRAWQLARHLKRYVKALGIVAWRRLKATFFKATS